jgi:hypothetical protein
LQHDELLLSAEAGSGAGTAPPKQAHRSTVTRSI